MAVLRGGAPHIGVKGRLDIVTSNDEGKTWSASKTVVDGPEDDRNPALGQLKNGDIILAYAILRGYDAGGLKLDPATRQADGVYIVRSSNGGKTWTKPELNESTHALLKNGGSLSPYGKIAQLPDGTALMSVYYEFPDTRKNQDYVVRSQDAGKTWGNPVLIGEHYNETGLLTFPDGQVLAALRVGNRRPPGYRLFERQRPHVERAHWTPAFLEKMRVTNPFVYVTSGLGEFADPVDSMDPEQVDRARHVHRGCGYRRARSRPVN